MLAGPAPSGSASASRLCRGCSHPPRRFPAQAAPSFAALLRQGQRRKVSHLHSNQQRLTAHEEVCQGAWVRQAFEGAPALAGVNVVRPVGRSALTPPARRLGLAAVPRPGGSWRARAGGSVKGAGPGSGWSEEPVSGVRPAALDFRVVPGCPPGPAFSVTGARVAAASWRQATPDRRRRKQRMASTGVFPPASLRRQHPRPGVSLGYGSASVSCR